MNNPQNGPQNGPGSPANRSPGAPSSVAGAVGGALAGSKPREEDSRTRAARRALELKEHLGGSMDEGTDKFYIDPKTIPDGWSYEWKTLAVLGKENPSYQVAVAQRGWEAVPRSRHPEMMPGNYRGETIEREGMILMERPLEITKEVQAAEYRKARGQVKGKEEQLGMSPSGQFERSNKGDSMVKVNKSYESIKIPEA